MEGSVHSLLQSLRRIKLNHEKDGKIHLIIWLTDVQLLEVNNNANNPGSYSFIEELKVLLTYSLINLRTHS